jgi:hypothetical protein
MIGLHEFGGVQSVKAWSLVPKYQPSRSPILTFLGPAVLTAASSGAIVNSFRMGG